jgi:hypothetical protein
MNTTHLPLVGPPGYEYKTTGPWFVCTTYEDHSEASVQWTMESAQIRFWITDADKPHLRKVMVDTNGICVLGRDLTEYIPRMVGTRETMEGMLDMLKRSPGWHDLDTQAEIMAIVVALEQRNGQSLL